MKKRLLALLLCLVMVIGLVPFALADDGSSSEESTHAKRTVNFYNDLSNGTMVNTIEVEIGTTFTQQQYNEAVTALGTKEGYSFAGWFQNSDGSNPFYVGNSWPTGDGAKGLYAKWTANDSNIQ